MFAKISRLLNFHPLTTFLIMAASFAGFSLATLDMFQMLSANLDYVSRDGVMALFEGGALQLVALAALLAVALLLYLLFKACERVLVDKLTGR